MLLRLSILIVTSLALINATPIWSRSPSRGSQLTQSRALEEYLLPSDILPISYDIGLVPFFETPENKNYTFDGFLTLNVVAVRPTNLIRMHAYDMDIFNITVKNEAGVEFISSHTMSTDDKQFLDINLEKSVVLGDKYTIYITYRGRLNDDLEGFYRSSYKDGDTIKWMAVTQFETTGARRAFPCFDEPAMKAKFTIHIGHGNAYKTILSNMDIVRDGPPSENTNIIVPGGYNITDFAESEVMSTYLVAFSVSNFDYIEHEFRANYRDWARPSLVQYAFESNHMAELVIRHMEDFTDIEYPLPKMDQIAVPDFAAGAMENWGLVTYRESAMLYIPGVSTTSTFMGVKSIVAHELAHQWFGDLVSPKWWSSIWLNEGFATYFSYDVLATVYPDWDQRNIFVQGEMHYAFQKDGLESTHPLLVYADSPSSTGAVFDTIAYSKGACIVHMIRNFLGDDAFKAAIKNYLTIRAYNSADKDDLWNGIRPHVPVNVLPEGVDIKAVMDTWVVQSGYPVVTVKRNYDDKTVTMTQERFLTLKTEETKEVWWIPLTMTSQNEPNFENTMVQAWHNGEELTLDITAETNDWLIVNVKQAGYYRVNYDSENWARLAKAKTNATELDKIAELNRAQIMDDALALARAAILDYNTALETTDYLDLETKYTPWNAALSAMNYIYDRLAYEEDTREVFESYVLGKLEHMYELVGGFEIPADEDVMMKRMRSLVLSWHCKLNNVTCNTQAEEMFDLWQQTPENNNIDPDLKSIVYCAGMRLGGETDYDFLFSKYIENEDRAAEQSLILSALGCATDTALLQKYLDESISETSAIRQQDARSVLSSVYNNYLGVDIALDFLLTNYHRLVEVYNGLGTMQEAFIGISVKLNTQEQRDKLQDFRDSMITELESSMLGAIDTALKNVDETLAWQKQHRSSVVSYFRRKLGLEDDEGGADAMHISALLLLITTTLYLIL